MAWTDFFDTLYRSGNIYTSFDNTSPAKIYGGTWTQIASKDEDKGSAINIWVKDMVIPEEFSPIIATKFTFYPVGSIYISYINRNPSELFGGTWVQITGRFLLAAGPNTDNTTSAYGECPAATIDRSTAGEQGGEAFHGLTIEEMPGHDHEVYIESGGSQISGRRINESSMGTSMRFSSNNYKTAMAGGNQPHNNMPPYIVVYVWRRTA